jgi:hypothetical protein
VVVATEVEFREIAVQMLLGTVLVGAEYSALENLEIAFNRVGRDDGISLASDVFVLLVVDGIVARKLGAELLVDGPSSSALMPFLEAVIRNSAASHLVSGILERSKAVFTVTVNCWHTPVHCTGTRPDDAPCPQAL